MPTFEAIRSAASVMPDFVPHSARSHRADFAPSIRECIERSQTRLELAVWLAEAEALGKRGRMSPHTLSRCRRAAASRLTELGAPAPRTAQN